MLRNYIEQYKKFKRFLGPKAWLLMRGLIALGLMWFAIELSFIYVIQVFLHSVGVISETQTFVPGWMLNSPIYGVLFFAFFGISRAVVSALRLFVTSMVPQTFLRHQRHKIFAFAISPGTMRMSSDLVALFSDRSGMAAAVVSHIGNLIIYIVTFVPFVAIGLFLAPKEFLLGGVLFAIGIFPLNRLSKLSNSVSGQITEVSKNLYYTLITAIKNRFLIWTYDLENIENIKAGKALDRSYEAHYKYFILSSVKGAYTLFVSVVVVTIVSYISIFYFQTQGMVLISLFYVFLKLGGLSSEINITLNEIRGYWPAFKETYQTTSKVESEKLELTLQNGDDSEPIHTIDVENLHFSYERNKLIINNLNFELRRGESILIKGQSGSGKSTLVSLLIGLLRPTAGSILINGKDITSGVARYHQQLGYVGPDPYIFPGTVRENILYGNFRSDISDDHIWEILKDAQLDDIIKELKGLDIFLNEDTQLSTGQKQRLSIARALLRRPSLIILDEATANLDSMTEDKIKEVLRRLKGNMITILISHKESFNEIADKCIQFEVENGASIHFFKILKSNAISAKQ